MDVQIIDYQSDYKGYFRDLNLEWIKKFFSVEPMDIQVLNNPESYIIEKGGWIGFALYKDDFVGTCALIPHNAEIIELGKMAVKDGLQGKGIGTTLGQAVIKQARKMGYKKVILETHSSLLPALRVYEKLGFVKIPLLQSDYARSDVRMEIIL